ncbi:MAG: Rieske 2Fe-2S domain-containing protein [Comamonadaceae bacterium]|jgi:nitrite reductase/ring-hydroxylating ferredoxin subunit
MTERVALCESSALSNSERAVPFEVSYDGRNCAAFAIRYLDHVYAYLNRCAHIPMEMDYQPDRFFDSTGQLLMCATHGATYQPQTGACRGGPCRGGLIKIDTSEHNGIVYWHTASNLKLPIS